MPQNARALIVRELGGPLTFEDVIVDDIRSNEALVKIEASGICRTDLNAAAGHHPIQPPAVFGHEVGAGTVLKVGESVTGVQPGDKVLLSYSICRICKQCCSGNRAYCEKILALNFGGTRADGSSALTLPDGQALFSSFFGQSSFSSLAVVNETSLVKVPSDTPLNLFAPLGCSMETGVGAIFNTLDVQPGSTVAVFGVGSLGLYAIMACKLRQAKEIIAIDIQPSRLELAKDLGATATINSSEGDVADQIRTICGTNGLERALDCSGVAKIIETMIESLGTRGKACSVGSNKPGTRISIDVHKHFVKGTQYVGSHQGDSDPQKMAPMLIKEHSLGNLPLHKVTTFYNVDDFQRALDDVQSGETVKAVLTWP
ncbi:GroES-like protein, partial [Aureobasidium melanogenum]|uniref:GroES-like protein n=1 Tax=Aureobasidium melanogenum (strain CBS 110374) TaxID=1043003 RepID=A0A074W080_AURM1